MLSCSGSSESRTRRANQIKVASKRDSRLLLACKSWRAMIFHRFWAACLQGSLWGKQNDRPSAAASAGEFKPVASVFGIRTRTNEKQTPGCLACTSSFAQTNLDTLRSLSPTSEILHLYSACISARACNSQSSPRRLKAANSQRFVPMR